MEEHVTLQVGSRMSPRIGPSGKRRPDQVLLRWSDTPDSPSHEQFVEMIESRSSEAVIRSASKVDEKTKVHLIGRFYTANGMVRSCHEDRGEFIVTIVMSRNPLMRETEGRLPNEPGLFAIESWLTEEAEDRILEGLEDETPRRRLPFGLMGILIILLKFQSGYLSLGLVRIIGKVKKIPSLFHGYMATFTRSPFYARS